MGENAQRMYEWGTNETKSDSEGAKKSGMRCEMSKAMQKKQALADLLKFIASLFCTG
jgi:hypothetical protein